MTETLLLTKTKTYLIAIKIKLSRLTQSRPAPPRMQQMLNMVGSAIKTKVAREVHVMSTACYQTFKTKYQRILYTVLIAKVYMQTNYNKSM